ncbi:hypothetical protein EFN04_06000 [Propionibacterium freudenreichii]|nr:hypothetical protein [Propionibacterium freudenreichii]
MSVLGTLDFQPMLITDVFDSMKASSAWYDKSKLDSAGEAFYPFVSRTKASNGVDGFCPRQEKNPEPGNAVTIGLDTQTIGYQPVPFYTSQNIQVLRHPRLNVHNASALAAALREQMGKFSWGGNGATLGRLKKTRIMVPVTTDEDDTQVVNWAGLDRLGAELLDEVITHTHGARQTREGDGDTLPDLRFAPMNVVIAAGREGLFIAHKGKRLIAAHRKPGSVPFVGAAKTNNSIVSFSKTETLFPGGWVTLVYNGDGATGHAKYQPVPFNASDDVIALEPTSSQASEDALLVLVCLLTEQCVPKFSFGYKLTLHRLARQKIMVPVTTDTNGDIAADWDGMTAYGRALRVRVERSMARALEVAR